MRYIGPKNRIARREATDLGLKTLGSKSHARLLKKLSVLPGQHGTRGRRKVSEWGFQLREKQKLRSIFGLNERQLKNYFHQAVTKKGNTGFFIAQLLENRLDNIIYRLGFAPTRAAARQLVCHGHIAVNGKKVTIPSYQTTKGETLTFKDEKTAKIPYIDKSLTNKDVMVPPWLEKQATVGKILDMPTADEIEKQVNLRLVIEFYSR